MSQRCLASMTIPIDSQTKVVCVAESRGNCQTKKEDLIKEIALFFLTISLIDFGCYGQKDKNYTIRGIFYFVDFFNV